MPYMYSEMQNKLSKIRDSPLESLGQIISSRCPYVICFICAQKSITKTGNSKFQDLINVPRTCINNDIFRVCITIFSRNLCHRKGDR